MDLALMRCCDLDQSVECACLVSSGKKEAQMSESGFLFGLKSNYNVEKKCRPLLQISSSFQYHQQLNAKSLQIMINLLRGKMFSNQAGQR